MLKGFERLNAYVEEAISYVAYYMGHIPNIDGISGDLFTLRIQYEYTQTQCDEGAKDGIDIWYMAHIIRGLYDGLGTSID